MLRYRVQDEYVFVGAVDGEIAGIVNGRLVNDKIGMSYHTITLKRGARVARHLFGGQDGVSPGRDGSGRGLDRGGEPQRLQALDDRV